ncbi:permease prefix domain 1-containing protein [Micromonospora sp. DSM 115977]|uniref:Permease prefix domain 1-containing protein n=1 Tax=Micromonospora reichwaldensis TaxID=3075516 RepID=A0ABU2X1C3_9ACTN|nr:permease prefix domain 1-containing protein [Micromonospora sp. DSM 115977]MDT0531932.1 permease prefix domain 1-containing protein [Micromonospora sp. DSM 115977]
MRGEDDATTVEERLRELGAHLRGPRRLKSDLLTEARHGLLDAVEAYRADGLPATEAQRRAVAEFGSPAQLAPAYQAELAAGALRGLSLRVIALATVAFVAGDLTWQGSSWGGSPPPAAYQLLSASVGWIWAAAFALAATGLLPAGRAALRGGADRAVGAALVGVLALGVLTGSALFAWSIGLWDDALTWPPMIIGAAVAAAGYLWLGRAARTWLLAAR